MDKTAVNLRRVIKIASTEIDWAWVGMRSWMIWGVKQQKEEVDGIGIPADSGRQGGEMRIKKE